MTVNIASMPHMYEWVRDFVHPWTGMCAGVGSGKTRGLQEKLLLGAALNPGCLGILVSPTFKMLQKNILNERNGFPVLLREQGLEYEFKDGNEYRIYWPNGATSYLECTHAGAGTSGRTAAFFGMDEADLMKPDDAEDIWNILIARLREPMAQVIFGTVASTPEGKKWFWKKFVHDLEDNPELAKAFKLYQASTYQNWFLPPSFIRNLENQYDSKRLRAHLYGDFVSLTEGQVYFNFDRKKNHTDEVIKEGEVLHTGWDFNKNGMSVTVNVERQNPVTKQYDPMQLDEVMGSTNTPAAIEALKERYPGHRIIAYPDATGKDVRSTATNEADHNLLRQAGIHVETTQANPRILNRVGSMTGIIESNGHRRWRINTKKCKLTTVAMELQTYGPDSLPTKGVKLPGSQVFIDGPLDAQGYYIDRRFPVRRPTAPTVRLSGH